MSLDITGHNWASLDATGGVWTACLGSSRTFGLRQVQAASPVGTGSVKLMAGQGLM